MKTRRRVKESFHFPRENRIVGPGSYVDLTEKEMRSFRSLLHPLPSKAEKLKAAAELARTKATKEWADKAKPEEVRIPDGLADGADDDAQADDGDPTADFDQDGVEDGAPSSLAEAFEELGAASEVAELAAAIAADGTKAEILDALDIVAPGHKGRKSHKLADLGDRLLDAVSTWS